MVKKYQVLIVDDSSEFAFNLSSLLKEIGVDQVDHVASVQSLVRAHQKLKKNYDLVLVDYQLVGHEGVSEMELCQWMSQLKASGSSVVLMGNQTLLERVDYFLAHGMMDYMLKNYPNAKLKNRLSEIFELLM